MWIFFPIDVGMVYNWCIYAPQGDLTMTRQSISFTTPNDEWLKAQLDSEEYTSKSEVVNDLIRKARAQEREMEIIRAKLIKAETSGFTDKTAGEIREEAREELRNNGEL